MNIILLGPQGSGKGTQARLLTEAFGFTYVCAGDILRDMANADVHIKEQITKGELIPDTQMLMIITQYLEKENVSGNVLFDGYPRSLEQYHLFKGWLSKRGQKVDLAIILTISGKETIRRLSARREDPTTGKLYNLITEPPGPDVNVTNLVQRDDDKPEAIARRLDRYNYATLPLINKLKEETKTLEVDGERPVEVIFKDIQNEVQKLYGINSDQNKN